MINRIFDYISRNPAIKAFIAESSTIIFGILSGTFVYEITLSGKLDWRSFYKASSFLFIIAWSFLICLYNYFLYKKECDILRFKDEDYCKAYIRSQCLPQITAKYKEAANSGNMQGLKEIRIEIKRLIK